MQHDAATEAAIAAVIEAELTARGRCCRSCTRAGAFGHVPEAALPMIAEALNIGAGRGAWGDDLLPRFPRRARAGARW